MRPCRYVDYMLLMTYNYHGSWNEFTGHHSAMFPRSDEVAAEREWNQVSMICKLRAYNFLSSLSVQFEDVTTSVP